MAVHASPTPLLPPCSNWDSECAKWLKGRVRTLPLCESSRDEAVASISQFLSPRNPYQVGWAGVCGGWGGGASSTGLRCSLASPAVG